MKETNFKQTELGPIPHDWEVKQLKNISSTASGGTPSRKNKNYFKGSIPWFTTGELCDCFLVDSVENISEDAIKNSSAKIFPSGTLLMAMYGATIGKLGILTNPSATNQACCAIFCEKANNTYLFYHLLQNRPRIIEKGFGAAQPNISQSLIQNLTIILPPVAEQRAIGKALSDVDELIDGLKKLIEKKRAIKQGAMSELLSGKRRLPGFDKSNSKFKKTGWKVFALGELGEPKMCRRIFKNQTTDIGEIPFFKIGTFGDKPDAFISNNLYQDLKSKYSFPKTGDILISAAGTIGRLIQFNGQDAYYQDSNIVWIDNDETKVLNSFLYFALKIANWKIDPSCTIARLYNSNLTASTIYAPSSLAEQAAIAAVLKDTDNEIESLEKKLSKYQQIKQGMMSQLLTGKIRLI